MKKTMFLLGLCSSLLVSLNVAAQCCPDCPPGVQGPRGLQGPAGVSGPKGPTGSFGNAGPLGPQGNDGVIGPQGVSGPQGPQGVQGPQGSTGPCCPGIVSYANVYSTSSQILIPADGIASRVLFEANNAVTSDFDISLAGINGEILFLRNGTYSLQFSVEALLDIFEFPVSIWTFGLFLDDVIVPGSVFGSFSLSPDNIMTHAGGEVIVDVAAGQVLTLKNTSTLPVNLVASPLGSRFPTACASVNIHIVD